MTKRLEPNVASLQVVIGMRRNLTMKPSYASTEAFGYCFPKEDLVARPLVRRKPHGHLQYTKSETIWNSIIVFHVIYTTHLLHYMVHCTSTTNFCMNCVLKGCVFFEYMLCRWNQMNSHTTRASQVLFQNVMDRTYVRKPRRDQGWPAVGQM